MVSAPVHVKQKIGEGTYVAPDAFLGSGVEIGRNCVVHAGTIIGADTRIGDCTVLGTQPLKSPMSSRKVTAQPPLKIGSNCTIGSLVLVSAGTQIGASVLLGDHVSIREENTIGSFTIVGKAVNMEYGNRIGERCKIMNNCHITGNMVIESDVFLGPCVTTMNDTVMDLGGGTFVGPTIRARARIGSNSTLLPAIEIGEYSVVGAGATVVKNVPPHSLVVGNPARLVRTVTKGYPISSVPPTR